MMTDNDMTMTPMATKHLQLEHPNDSIDEYYKHQVTGSGLCRPAITINADENDRESSLLSHKNASHPIRHRPFVPYARRNSTAMNNTKCSPPSSPNSHATYRTGGNSSWNMIQQHPSSPSTSPFTKHNTATRRCISSPHIDAPTKPMANTTTVRRRHSSSAKTNFCTSRSQRYASSSSCAASVSQHQVNHCESCGTTSSPEWRKGPSGHKT